MKIQLSRDEVRRVLQEKYGYGTFTMFYRENDYEWEARTGEKLVDREVPPDDLKLYYLHF